MIPNIKDIRNTTQAIVSKKQEEDLKELRELASQQIKSNASRGYNSATVRTKHRREGAVKDLAQELQAKGYTTLIYTFEIQIGW